MILGVRFKSVVSQSSGYIVFLTQMGCRGKDSNWETLNPNLATSSPNWHLPVSREIDRNIYTYIHSPIKTFRICVAEESINRKFLLWSWMYKAKSASE